MKISGWRPRTRRLSAPRRRTVVPQCSGRSRRSPEQGQVRIDVRWGVAPFLPGYIGHPGPATVGPLSEVICIRRCRRPHVIDEGLGVGFPGFIIGGSWRRSEGRCPAPSRALRIPVRPRPVLMGRRGKAIGPACRDPAERSSRRAMPQSRCARCRPRAGTAVAEGRPVLRRIRRIHHPHGGHHRKIIEPAPVDGGLAEADHRVRGRRIAPGAPTGLHQGALLHEAEGGARRRKVQTRVFGADERVDQLGEIGTGTRGRSRDARRGRSSRERARIRGRPRHGADDQGSDTQQRRAESILDTW